ncbi:hypothetical protein GOBAR_AA27095 [Gossypium barbadense]|uniref:Disease resistance N-terminal domain-containing protein n=1 Tax=Gossypium barbadense TaxID=3634 RepID=A0A2P5WR42_GOSBA|nr:hypothetical protein GOBAR_AA27095 [Gossypium barbadense]
MVAREPFLTGLLQFLLNSLASIKNLVSDLRYLLYDMEDTVDEFSTEYLRCKLMAQRQAISNMCNGKHSKESSNARHLSYFHGKYDNQERIEQLYNVGSLRTYLPLQRLHVLALILKICFYLKKWPATMYNLTNLQYLDITNVNSLEKMTVGMKELKTLHMLPQFVVENNVGSGIRDLKELKLFQQSFNINRLERVVDSQEASNAELKDMNVLCAFV